MLKYYIAYIKQRLKPEHLAKMELTVILFCLLTILLGPPLALRTQEKVSTKELTVSLPKQVVFEQIPPPEPPAYIKE